MTIQREYPGGPFVAQCNECLDTEELLGTTRQEAVKDAQERGYKLQFEARKCTCRHCTQVIGKAAEKAFRDAEDRYEQSRERQAAA